MLLKNKNKNKKTFVIEAYESFTLLDLKTVWVMLRNEQMLSFNSIVIEPYHKNLEKY